MIEIKTANLHAALEAVRRFASKDESRVHLCAVCLDFEPNKLTVVTTHGHALARYTMFVDCERTVMCVVPLDVAEQFRKLLKSYVKDNPTAQLDVHDTYINVVLGGITSRVALMDRTFPPYNKVIPDYTHKPEAATIGVAGEYLADACASFGGKRSTLRFVFKDPLDPIEITGAQHPHHNPTPGFEPENLTIIVMPMRI